MDAKAHDVPLLLPPNTVYSIEDFDSAHTAAGQVSKEIESVAIYIYIYVQYLVIVKLREREGIAECIFSIMRSP